MHADRILKTKNIENETEMDELRFILTHSEKNTLGVAT